MNEYNSKSQIHETLLAQSYHSIQYFFYFNPSFVQNQVYTLHSIGFVLLAASIVWEHWPDTPEVITWTNALQNRCYMCIQWTRVLYSVVVTWQSNPPISQINSLCNEFTSVWSMFVYNTISYYIQYILYIWHFFQHGHFMVVLMHQFDLIQTGSTGAC